MKLTQEVYDREFDGLWFYYRDNRTLSYKLLKSTSPTECKIGWYDKANNWEEQTYFLTDVLAFLADESWKFDLWFEQEKFLTSILRNEMVRTTYGYLINRIIENGVYTLKQKLKINKIIKEWSKL